MPPNDSTQIPQVDFDKFLSGFRGQEVAALAAELEKRETEALRLFDPLRFQNEFLGCTTKECIIQKGNQVGGTLVGAMELARAVTGQDPFCKYPARDGVAVIIGYGEKHIGRVIHKTLFRPGAFKMIRDANTGRWRVYKPWQDADREKEAKLAPPLIPNRHIKEMVWEKKGERVFSLVIMENGWEIHALNSAGDPSQAQGFQADLVWIDEDLANTGWYDEMLGRTAVRDGKIRWTALPHAKNDDIINMIERGAQQANLPASERRTTVVRATMFDNPYYPLKAREENVALWKSQGEDVYRQRVLGEICNDSVLMYPGFHKDIHGLRLNYEEESEALEIEKILRGTDMNPPPDWCNYMIVDPGHTVCAVVYVTVPPPKYGDWAIVYNENYITNADATKFGNYVRQTTNGATFQAFIIDAHGAALRDIGGGVTPREQYSQKLRDANIQSIETKFSFLNGSDDVQGRALVLREWLAIRRDGHPKLRIIAQRCPNLVREFGRFKKKKIKDVVTDAPDTRTPCHAIQCVEYAVAHGLPYKKPVSNARMWTVVDAWERMKSRGKEKRAANAAINGSDFVNLGPQG